MTKVLSFTRLDINTVRPYWKSLIIMIGIGLMLGMVYKNFATVAGVYMIYSILLSTYPFSIGDKNGTDMLFSTLSLRRSQIVRGRYLFALLGGLAAIALSLAACFLISATLKTDFRLPEITTALSILFCAFSIAVSFQYPLFFKLGYNKAKFVAFTPFLIMGIGAPILAVLFNAENSDSVFQNFAVWGSEHPIWLSLSAFLSGVLLLAISCTFSTAVYRKRDF